MKPKIEELRSWQEVIEEENTSRRFYIPGRYHQYMGEE
jgi:hypothetical protein